MKRVWSLFLAAALTSGCGSFRQPPLPRPEKTAALPPPPEFDPAWAAKLRAAETIYFSLTKSSTAPEQPIWKIVQLLQGSGQRLAFGWAEIAATQQPRLEQWTRQEISTAQLLDELVRPERAALLRPAFRPDLGQAALGCARDLLGKIRDGTNLSPEEEAELPVGYQVRAEAFEDFSDRVASSPHLRHYQIHRLFRAHLVAEETIADSIVRFHREHSDARLLVFLPNDAMIDPREIADFAAQKMPLRQLILDRSQPLRETQPQLVQRSREGETSFSALSSVGRPSNGSLPTSEL
ncbi:MAG: ChaN family lipoprotein [Chthoniobacterales bacterium]|nr:ChaN family lipoprotein [Chthoniobacterales bacterium]